MIYSCSFHLFPALHSISHSYSFCLLHLHHVTTGHRLRILVFNTESENVTWLVLVSLFQFSMREDAGSSLYASHSSFQEKKVPDHIEVRSDWVDYYYYSLVLFFEPFSSHNDLISTHSCISACVCRYVCCLCIGLPVSVSMRSHEHRQTHMPSMSSFIIVIDLLH